MKCCQCKGELPKEKAVICPRCHREYCPKCSEKNAYLCTNCDNETKYLH